MSWLTSLTPEVLSLLATFRPQGSDESAAAVALTMTFEIAGYGPEWMIFTAGKATSGGGRANNARTL
jgi:hypothetical protein